MKTSEFKRKISDLGLTLVNDEYNVWKIYEKYDKENIWFLIGDVNKEYPFLQTGEQKCFRRDHSNILNLVIEYFSTPLEEREEEKKYRLVTPFAMKRDLNYLAFNLNDKTYFISDNIDETYFEKSFTKKEIYAMPFDTNFFIKEEVK